MNLISFNFGVDLGQRTALALIHLFMQRWHASPGFGRQAYTANVIMIGLGTYLMDFQFIGLAQPAPEPAPEASAELAPERVAQPAPDATAAEPAQAETSAAVEAAVA